MTSAESISTSDRVRLDHRIERVLPHYLKMTETALILISLPMSASPLPLSPIEQVPRRLYQATDWRDWGQSSPLDSRHTPASLHYHYRYYCCCCYHSHYQYHHHHRCFPSPVTKKEKEKGKREILFVNDYLLSAFTFFQTVWVCWIG